MGLPWPVGFAARGIVVLWGKQGSKLLTKRKELAQLRRKSEHFLAWGVRVRVLEAAPLDHSTDIGRFGW
jgi:hypothetical protein